MSRAREKAEKEWFDASVMERIGMLDPDAKRELLSEFTIWCDKQRDSDHETQRAEARYAGAAVNRFLAAESVAWIDGRESEIEQGAW